MVTFYILNKFLVTYKSIYEGPIFKHKDLLFPGVNILQKEEDFVLGIFRMLQGRNPIKFDDFKRNN